MSQEYLSNLQPLTKWQDATDAPKAGDVVFILEDNVLPLHWPRARIEELYLGNDKIARVAKVFNGKSSFIRPLSKLRLLPNQSPIKEEQSSGSDPTMQAESSRSDPTMQAEISRSDPTMQVEVSQSDSIMHPTTSRLDSTTQHC